MSYSGYRITPEGGLAVRMINKTGANTVKGYVVGIYSATAVNLAVKNMGEDELDPVGIIYESGIADGSYVWVVVAGIADVFFGQDTINRGYLARVYLNGEDSVPGKAWNETVPTSPFAIDKHFMEIGHVLESKSYGIGGGLAKCLIHFN